MYLDIVGSCNLKCPSCPMGNSENKNYKKPMPLDVFSAIIKKAKAENIDSIHLYNWTEPLIHPKIGEFISITENNGISCGISSNLNTSKNIEEAIKSNPSFFRISLSGFNQDTYKIGHAGGDIEIVKNNMILLSELKLKYQSKTYIEVYYHRYLDNIDDEARMREFSEQLGFSFSSGMSIMMPLEKVVAVVESDESKITDEDKKIMARMALPPTPQVIKLAKIYKENPCALKDGMLTLDAEGNVILCCAVFDQRKHSIGNYLNFPIEVIQNKKNTEPQCTSICNTCMSKGLHIYYQSPQLFQDYGDIRMIEHRAKTINNRKNITISFRTAEKINHNGIEFDEIFYLESNPDVKVAVAKGFFESGYDHYLKFGEFEKRKISAEH
ncbi:MAG: hypothetical protein PHT57_08595 [Rhodoferax sp.]|nr:hypothetical protein [Rhodoferax sp.]